MTRKSLINVLSSMKVAIGLFIALGIIAAFGTLIPQGFSDEVYLETYGTTLGRAVLWLGLDHLYTVWWFVGLGLVLTVSVLACSLRRLRHVRGIHAIGSLCLHFALVLVILGAVASGLFGSSEMVNLGIHESKQLTEGGLKGYEITVDDFEIEYYDGGSASQYYCGLRLTDPKGISIHDNISVNQPYHHDHIKIYQQTYGWEVMGRYVRGDETLPFRLKENESVDLGDGKMLMVRFVPDFDERSQSLQSRSAKPNNPVMVAAITADDYIMDMVTLHPGKDASLGGGKLYFEQYGLYSGLHVKKDIGVPMVYAGFALLLVGLGLRYLPIPSRKKGGDA